MKHVYRLQPFAFVLCTLISMGSFAEQASNLTAVGKFDVTVLTEEDMRKDIGLDLYQAEDQLYQMKKDWVAKKAKDAFFDQAAKTAGLSRKEWEKREIDDKDPAPTSEEVQQFLKENVPPAEASKPETAHKVTDYLTKQKRDKQEEAVYQTLLTQHHLEILVAKPIAPRINVAYASDDPAKGSPRAPVTIVEFTDFQCPYCKKSQEVLAQVEKAYPNQVKLVARQFPLPFHERAEPAAEAAMCAKEQGKFWEYRDKLFEKQELSDEDFKRYARELGLKKSKFEKCLSEHRYAARVTTDIAAAQGYGVKGTPAFFINGQPLLGAYPFEAFQEAINDALAQKK